MKKINLLQKLQFLILIGSAVYNFDFFAGTKLYGNAASRVLLAVGPMLGIGSPYKDLYELVPPGYLIFIAGWVRTFGLSMDSFRFIQVFLVLVNGFFLMKVLEKLFKNKILQFFIFTAIIITVHSWVIQTDFFSIDFFATTLVLGGLAALFHIKNKFLQIPLAATLFILASQMKDIYILSVVSLLPFYLREFLKKNKQNFLYLVSWSLFGGLVILTVILTYLTVNGSMNAYLNILKDKAGYAQPFSPRLILRSYLTMLSKVETTFSLAPNLIFGLIAVNGLIIINSFKNKLKKFRSRKFQLEKFLKQTWLLFDQQLKKYGEDEWGRVVLTLVLIVFVLYGLTIYGLYHGSQLIMIVTSYYLGIGILLILPLQIIAAVKSRWLKVVATLLILSVFIPKHIPLFFNFVPMQRDYPFEIEKDILNRVDKDECILHVHGWEIAISYIYTQRRPCSKYFLANELFNIKRTGVIQEYRQQLIKKPPAVILYNEKGSDLDIEKFNREVIDFPKILSDCYEPDPRYTDYMKHFFAQMTLYWPKEGFNKQQLISCWVKNSR